MDIITSADRAEQLSASFVTSIVNFEKQVTEREQKALASAAKFGRSTDGQDPDLMRLIRQNAQNQAKREAHAYRRELVTETDAQRTSRLKDIMGLEAQAAQLAPLFERPQQLLGRQGLGSPERSRYHEQLRFAGPAELVSMRDWALHTRDRNLGAAILSRLDTIPTKSRPFDAAEFAMQLVGEEFNASQKGIARVRIAAQRALNANRDFERGRVDAMAKIGMGLAQRSVQR